MLKINKTYYNSGHSNATTYIEHYGVIVVAVVDILLKDFKRLSKNLNRQEALQMWSSLCIILMFSRMKISLLIAEVLAHDRI